MKAKIVDNKLYCNLCGSPLGNTSEYRQVEYNEKSYTEFSRYCSNKKCREISTYLLDLRVDDYKRIVANEDEITAIKSE